MVFLIVVCTTIFWQELVDPCLFKMCRLVLNTLFVWRPLRLLRDRWFLCLSSLQDRSRSHVSLNFVRLSLLCFASFSNNRIIRRSPTAKIDSTFQKGSKVNLRTFKALFDHVCSSSSDVFAVSTPKLWQGRMKKKFQQTFFSTWWRTDAKCRTICAPNTAKTGVLGILDNFWIALMFTST